MNLRNKFIYISLTILLSLASVSTFAQRKYVSFHKNDNIIHITTSEGQYRVKFYNQNIVENTYIPQGEKFQSESHSVDMTALATKLKVKNKKNILEISSPGLKLQINKSNMQFSYFYNNEALVSEAKSFAKTDSSISVSFNIKPQEVLFGGGARALGMNRRGNNLKLYNRAHYAYGDHSELMNYTMPLVISENKYAINFDNAPIGYLDLDSKKNNTINYESISGRMCYQIIVGDTWANFMQEFTLLTGRQDILPIWAYGNFASRFGYHSQEETLSTIDKFHEEGIPVDAIILDLFWFGKEMKGNMGTLAFHRDSFPEPVKMIQKLKDKGVKTILISEPFILTTSKRWDDAVKSKILATDKNQKPYTFDFYFGNTGLVDVFKPEAKTWFWNIYKSLAEKGVSGWWGDLGEPEVHPSDLQHVNGSADQVHNIYGHQWAKLIWESYKREMPEVRPFILMRAGAVGSQRFGMVPWSGDVSRSWAGLKPQTEISLQMGMQGMAYMHSDLGGFAGNNLDNELYVRWLQYGVFQPVFRPHAQEDVPPEPVFREHKTMLLAKEAIKLRYKLLPYNYTLAFENSQSGIPLMRPLFFYDNNKELLNISDTYLWGKNFLVSTVCEEGLKEKKVYMPKSYNWFDFYTGKKYTGGQTYSVKLKQEYIPVFVRGGSFIPTTKPMMSTDEYDTKDINIDFYYDASLNKSNDKLYFDDGKTTLAYAKGIYQIIRFTSKVNSKKIKINVKQELGAKFQNPCKSINMSIKNITHNIKKIKYNGSAINYKWNKETSTLSFTLNKVSKSQLVICL